MTSDKSNLVIKIKRISSYLLPLILTGMFLIFAFKGVDINKAFILVTKISFPWLIVFLFTFMLSHFIRAIRWQVMIHSVKSDTSIVHLLGAIMVGYGVNCLIPRLGELYRGLFLGKWEKISRSSMLGTILVERVIDIIALIIAVLISVIIYSGNLYTDMPWLSTAINLSVTIIAGIIVFLILIVHFKDNFYNGITRFIGLFSKKGAEGLSYIYTMVIDGFSSLKGWKNYSLVIFWTAVMIIVYGLTTYLGLQMLKMDEYQPINYGMAWVIMSIAAFGIVIPTPGGTGSYHAIAILVLTQLYNFSLDISAAYALLTHFISYAVFILSTFFFIYLINKNLHLKGSNKESFFSVLKLNSEEK